MLNGKIMNEQIQLLLAIAIIYIDLTKETLTFFLDVAI